MIKLFCLSCGSKLQNCAIINCKKCSNFERYCFTCGIHRAIDVLFTDEGIVEAINNFGRKSTFD